MALVGFPSRIGGSHCPAVLGNCPQYPPLQMRTIAIAMGIVIIIVTVGIPGMILSLQDMGLGIKAHSSFKRENGFGERELKRRQ